MLSPDMEELINSCVVDNWMDHNVHRTELNPRQVQLALTVIASNQYALEQKIKELQGEKV